MPTLAEIRAGLGPAADRFTDEQLYNAALQAFGPLYSDPKLLTRELGYDPKRDFTRGLEIATRGTGAALAGAGAALADTVGWESGRDAALGFAQAQQTRAQQLGRSYDDVDNFSQNPLGFLSSAAGQAVGYAVPSLVGGGAVGLGAKVLGRSALAGYGLGAGVSNLAQETGSIYNDLAEQGIYDPGRALAFGAPAAALDTASEMVPFLKGAGTGNLLRRVGTGALKQAGTEAGTEVLQTSIERAGAYKDVLSPEAWHEYRNAAALGAIGGGMFGGAMGLRRPDQPAAQPATDNPLNPTDLLKTPPAPETWADLAGPAPAPVTPTTVDPRFTGFGNVDPYSLGDNPYGTYGLTYPRSGGERAWSPAFPEDVLERDVPPVLTADTAGGVSDARYFDDLSATQWRDLPGTNAARWAIGQPALPDPGSTPMQPGAQMPISGADDPGLALARQRYEEQLRAAEEQKTKAAELQAQVEAAQARHAANRQAAVDALVDKKPDGSPVVPVRDREIATFTALRELHSAGVVDDATYADLAGRMREAYTLDDKMRPKALNAVAKEVASLKEQANAAGAGTDGAARPADVGRGAGDQRAPGQPGGVRPAGAQTAAQGVVGAGTTELGSAGGRGDGALTGEQIVERIQQLDPVEQAYVGRWLGVDLDDEGNLALREQGAESLRAMEKSLGVSYETVRERVKAALVKLGLPKGMKPKQLYEQLGLTVANTDLETLERNVDMSTPASEAGTGDLDTVVESTSEDALDGVGDTEVRVERAQLATDELVPEIPDQDPTGRQREVAGPIDEGSMDLEDRVDEARALTLDSALEGDVSAGRVTADDITEAQYFYEQNRQRGMAPWGRLDVPMRAAYVRTYARARLAGDPAVLATKKALYGNATPERTGAPADADAARGDARGPADGGDVATEEGGTGGQSAGSEVQAPRGPVSVVTKRKRRVVRPEPAEAVADESWGNQLERSRGDTAEDAVFYDRDQLEDDLLTFMNADSLGRHVLIVDDASELTNAADMEAAMDPSTRAWVRGEKTVLIANRIPAGQGRAIFLHEVGSHLGLQRLLGEQEFDALSSKIIAWANRGGKSRETQIAKRAMERVDQAGETDPTQRLNELVAYFIEEAVNAGVNPTALKYDTELGRWMRSLWAAFKVALRKLGVNSDKLTAQDVVDLAYGAARLNVTGRFHGTAAKVQQFRTKYIGTGEGAQAYGWGLYFAELRGVAEEYKKADVKRKSGGVDGQPGRRDMTKWHRWGELKRQARDEDNLGFDTVFEMLAAYRSDRRAGANFTDSYDVSPVLLNLLKEAVDYYDAPARTVKGNLYATDIAVREDEMLDWTAPLDQQPAAVKRVLDEKLGVKRKRSVQDTMQAMRELRESIPGGEDVQPILRYVTLRWGQLAQRGEYKKLTEIALERTEDDTPGMDAVRELKRRIDAWFDASDVSETLKAEGYENTGGGLYRYLESLAQDNEGPFAPDMRVDDFLDRMVAKYDVMDQVGPNYKRLNSEKLDRAMTAEEAAELKRLQGEAKAAPWRGGGSAAERVSRWLDSIGIKGVRMPVNYQRGGTYTEGRNFVVFNEKNVIRALDNPANRVSRSVQFSMAPPTWTEAFKRWFGNSKVVDERGDPLVVYHGAAGDDFEAFSFDKHLDRESGRKRRYVSYLGRVFYFSPDKREAGDFAMYESDGVGARVVPVYLKTSKPFDMRSLTAKEKIAFADAVLKALPENKKYNFAFIRGIALSYTGDELYNQAADDLGHADKANDILKSMGYDGIISMTGDMGLQYAVFDATQIKSTFNQSPTSDPRIQYSKGRSAADQVAALQQITDKLPQPAKNAWTDIKDFTVRKLPYVMTTFQIFEQFGDRLRRLGDMIRANDLMRQESTALQMKVDDIVKRWDKLPKAAGDLLSQVALRATLLGAHPDKAWAHEANAHVPRDRQGEYNELRQLYDRLKATSPEGVKLYHDALAAFEDQRQQLEKATERMFAQYGKVMPKVKRVPGPYFPLVRRGDYLAIGESPQLVALKKQLETLAGTEGNDEAIADLNSRIDQLEADGQHFWVSSHENRSGMENALKEYESRGLVGRRSMADQRLGALPTRNLHSTIAALTAEATKNLSKDGAKEVSNALAEILLRSLPEGHALERQAARKGVAGAMEDMKRAVAVAGRQNAYYIARLNHAKEVADALHEMGRDAKGDINLEHVYRELEQRHALNMQWHDTPWQDAIGKAAWTWFLGASPAFLAINAAQPWLVSAPVMAGEYGAGAATRELARATADAFKVMKQARWKDGKFDLWSGIDPDAVEGRFMTRNEKGEQISEERKALRELIQRGVIDEGLSPELAMYAESGGTGLLTKLSRAFGWPAQQVELVNRVATALAAFRLERAKQGGRPDAYQKALDKAYATVVNTHVDYGAENAPRVMREGGGIPLAKLVFQFRRYQQAMMYLLASNVAKLRNPAEQKMARATLGYLALTSGMAGGVVGLPLAGTVMFLKDLFGDDDDEEGDAKARLRNTLYDLTGDKTLADVLAKGVPTLFGMDIAERAGMGQVTQLFPRLDLSRSKTAEDKLGKTLVAVAGPAGGLAVQGMDAASFFGAGDWVRGTERLLPKMMADPLRAARERVTGQEDRKGEQLMSSEELNYWDTIRRVAGVSSVRESDRFEADRALKSIEQGMNDRRSRIHAEFRRALRSGDFEDVRGMIDEYNADHPDMPIKPKDEAAWRKEAQRAVSERDPETGLKITRRQQPLAEVQRFARP